MGFSSSEDTIIYLKFRIFEDCNFHKDSAIKMGKNYYTAWYIQKGHKINITSKNEVRHVFCSFKATIAASIELTVFN